MNPRHEKHKPHLVKQYEAQIKIISDCILRASLKLFVLPGTNKGSYYSERFKK